MTTTDTDLHLTITAAIHARWAHRVDGLIHSHPWSVEATVEEIARRLWEQADELVPGLVSIAVVESTEFDRCRTVRLTRQR